MTVKETVKVATVKDVMAQLSKMPSDSPIYFDCPHCRKAGGFHRLDIAVMVTTRELPQ